MPTRELAVAPTELVGHQGGLAIGLPARRSYEGGQAKRAKEGRRGILGTAPRKFAGYS
jgi:hypothetical protein